jgi:hypothetical protein
MKSMRFLEMLWEVVRSDGFVDGLMVRSWRLPYWVLAMWFHLSLLSPARFLDKELLDWDMRRSQIRLTNNIFIQTSVIIAVRLRIAIAQTTNVIAA